MSLRMKTCKEVAALLIAREDRVLPWTDRAALRVHLWFCDACPIFQRQMLHMRNAMRQWRNYTVSDASETPDGSAQ